MAKGTKFERFLAEQLKDSKLAAQFITEAMEEYDEAYLARALSEVVKAHGMSKVVKATHLSRQALYKMFSTKTTVRRMVEATGRILNPSKVTPDFP